MSTKHSQVEAENIAGKTTKERNCTSGHHGGEWPWGWPWGFLPWGILRRHSNGFECLKSWSSMTTDNWGKPMT